MWRAFWEVETPQRKALCLGCWFQSMRDELDHITKYGMRTLTDWQIHVGNLTNWMPQITWNTCEDFTKLSTYLPRLLNFCCVHQLVVMDMVVQDALASACTHRRWSFPWRHQDGLVWMTWSFANLIFRVSCFLEEEILVLCHVSWNQVVIPWYIIATSWKKSNEVDDLYPSFISTVNV